MLNYNEKYTFFSPLPAVSKSIKCACAWRHRQPVTRTVWQKS